ncbi:YciI family protein [Actinopolymorpha sp. NPDC004070]|uniref:YciI family protein n=1 Tax=Actinopolymorpha sp. NPDC004070 TaxID=3154548 RepID=UPI0033A0D394
MPRYLISFDNAATDLPAEDLPEVAKAVQAVREEAMQAGVFVFAGELDHDVKSVVVDTDGMVTDGPYPESKELLGGVTIVEVPGREAALEWGGRVAAGCRTPQKVRALRRDGDGPARYLISFDNGDMDFPDEEWASVGETSHAAIQDTMDAGVYVFSGGLDYEPPDESTPAWVGAVTADGTVADSPRPKTTRPLGGFAVVKAPTHEAALEWAAKIAVAHRCGQWVRMFMYDPILE